VSPIEYRRREDGAPQPRPGEPDKNVVDATRSASKRSSEGSEPSKTSCRARTGFSEVDLVERGQSGDHVIDLKSGVLTQDQIDDHHLGELMMYAHLWEGTHGVTPVDLG
jgi:hypothetical protein